MIKKILIIGLIVSCFLITSMLSVCAADEEKSFTDPKDDVLDIDGNNVSTKPNIDIIAVNYIKEGKEVTLTLIVKGNIENRGDLGIIENMDDAGEDSFNLVYYAISLYTLEHSYEIIYINKKCNFTIDSEEVGELTYFSYVGSTLKFIFDLKDQDEIYAGLTVETADVSSLEKVYEDYFMDFVEHEQLYVTINAPSTGKVGQSIDFSANVSGGTSYEYEWYFDEDLEPDSTDESPTYTYNEAGTYNVTLLVSDSEGRQGYDYLTITISEDGTSNGGGKEDESSNSAILLFAAIIVIIVIIGVAVIIFIIRR